MSPTIGDLAGVEVEHLLGLVSRAPLVKVRAIADDRSVLVGQIDPADARRIAGHLLEAAARAEYEHDLFTEAVRIGMDDEAIGVLLAMVRTGERRRHEGGGS